MGCLKIFWVNGKKAKRDIQTYIHTYIHTYRLPLVVLSAALQQKTNYQSFGHSVIQSSVIPPTLLAEEIRFLSQNEEIWFSGKNEEIRFSGQNYLHFWEFVKKKKSRNLFLKIEQSSSPSSILASSCTFTFTSCCTVCPRSSDPFNKVTYYRHLDIYLIWEICVAIYNIRLKLCSRNRLKII